MSQPPENDESVVDRGNPYRSRIKDHPGRILCFDDFDSDQKQLGGLLNKYPKTICEIGSGSGRHLLSLAVRDPKCCCLGFELRYKRSVRTLEKAVEAEIDNAYVLRVDAKLVTDLFPSKSLDAIYVNYPDPWQKRRTRKHRTLTADFLDMASRLLKPGGFISVKTDHREYFDSFMSALEVDKRFEINLLTRDVVNSEFAELSIETEFECLFRGQGIELNWVEARVVAA